MEANESQIEGNVQSNFSLQRSCSELNLEEMKKRRLQIMEAKSKEIFELREAFAECKRENEELKLLLQQMKRTDSNKDLQATDSGKQELKLDIMQMQEELGKLNKELGSIKEERLQYTNHVTALKDMIKVSKTMLGIREKQIEDLKMQLKTVQDLMTAKEMQWMSDDLRKEYERQLKNMKDLRKLYEERQRIDKRDKELLQAKLDDSKKICEEQNAKIRELEERLTEVESENSEKYDKIITLESNLGFSKAEYKDLKAEIDVINQLFSEILFGFNNTQEVDLDSLLKLLEDNHGLLTNILTKEEHRAHAAALPKLLLQLICQMDNVNVTKGIQSIPESSSHETENTSLHQLNSTEEIIENLPKVWRILIELLSNHIPPFNIISDSGSDPCYATTQTASGPKLKLSVSRTFIRLKDLILEKNSLEKEVNRLKHLNSHLETRLTYQETRLEVVSGELSKTWRAAEKMQKQYQQLRTHEKIIRYELRQKRILLSELKEDLEECRDKWLRAKQKNNSTEEQWKELRKEFAQRKSDNFNNQSGESGYSDDKSSSDDETESSENIINDTHNLEIKMSKIHVDKFHYENKKTENTLLMSGSENETFFDDVSTNETSENNELYLINEIDENELVENIQEIPIVTVNTNNLVDIVNANINGSISGSSNARATSSNDFEEKSRNITSSEQLKEGKNALTLPFNKESKIIENESITTSGLPTVNYEFDQISKPDATINELIHKQEIDTNISDKINYSKFPSEIMSINKDNYKSNDIPCSSNSDDTAIKDNTSRSANDILAARDLRLKRLEEQCAVLVQKVSNTTQKSDNISSKLDILHDTYGECSREQLDNNKTNSET